MSKKIDFKDYLSHILIHGILHLKGYTHEKEEDTRLMQNEEKRKHDELTDQNKILEDFSFSDFDF